VHTRPTAGQATTEYIAVVALIAAILALAAPAVGAPALAGVVVRQMERALCIAGLDICDAQMAADAGLAPCPLKSDLTGHEGALSFRYVEVGGRTTWTVTPNSDGTVSVVRTLSASGGVTAGKDFGRGAGPLAFEIGASGTIRTRVQGAQGWEFPDRATAERFLEHSVTNTFSDDFPPTWRSVEDSRELVADGSLSVGGEGFAERGDLLSGALSASGGLGAKVTRGAQLVTVYGRVAFEAPEVVLPLGPSKGVGRVEGIAEVTFTRDRAPREIAIRLAQATDMGDKLTETVMRLDLRDPANRAFADSLLHVPWPWGRSLADDYRRLTDRMASHGTIERTVSSVEDDSKQFGGSLTKKLGGGYKRIDVHRALVEASARAGGFERRRLDCQVPSK